MIDCICIGRGNLHEDVAGHHHPGNADGLSSAEAGICDGDVALGRRRGLGARSQQFLVAGKPERLALHCLPVHPGDGFPGGLVLRKKTLVQQFVAHARRKGKIGRYHSVLPLYVAKPNELHSTFAVLYE